MNKLNKVESELYGGLGNLHSAIVKLKEGRVLDVNASELTHPRIIHFYNQQHSLYTALGEKWYEGCIRKLRGINSTVDLELYLPDLEEKYKKTLLGKYSSELAAEEAHLVSKVARKMWYRMRTDFDRIEDVRKQRVEYVHALGDYLNSDYNIRKAIDLLLINKDLATGTDADWSDMDLAFSFNVRDKLAARGIAINAIAPAIKKFETIREYPPNTAHIDWESQTYATPWLLSVAKQPSSTEPIFDGFKTNTYTRRYLAENIFGICGGVPPSIPIYPLSNKELYEELIAQFTSREKPKKSIPILDISSQNEPVENLPVRMTKVLSHAK